MKMRVCTDCGAVLPATFEFFSRARYPNLRGDCRNCHREKNNARAATKREEKRLYDMAYREAHQEELAAKKARYYCEHPDEIRAKAKAWRAVNYIRHRASAHRRRAMMCGERGTYKPSDVRDQYERQRGRCYYCDARVGSDYHIDHVVPLARGGSNTADNLVVACPSCNLSKHTRLPHEFSGRLC